MSTRRDRGSWGDAAFTAQRKPSEQVEVERLRQQVADLRAALGALDAVLHFDIPWGGENGGAGVRTTAMNAAMRMATHVLLATQPQEVQG